MDGQKIIKRGNNLFNQLRSFLAAHSNIRLTKEMTFLDFGCGSGGMLHTLLQNGFDAFGVDCDLTGRNNYSSLTEHTPSSLSRWVYYDGSILPFATQTFDIVYSWFVIEHIRDLKLSLKEMARVVKPGGIITLFTQDVRSAYDGHVKIPWPPFLHSDFYEAYLDEWDKADWSEYMKNSVYYVTSDEILSVLRYFKMNILFSSDPFQFAPNVSLNIRTSEEARKAARYFKEVQAIGKWNTPDPQIYIIAQKPA